MSEVREKSSTPGPAAGVGGGDEPVDDVTIRDAVVGGLNARTVVAVSGGPDSFALLAAAHRWVSARLVAVATFDHGTGSAARAAVARVRAWCAPRGIPVIVGRAPAPLAPTEAAWRAARWHFLRAVAASHDATIATGHTRDDQAETVLMRLLRGAGVRGLAALAAPSPIRRPFLAVPRAVVHGFAQRAALPVVVDPTNRDPTYLRSRVRHALLPALARAEPDMVDWLVGLGARAAAWRAELAALAESRASVTIGAGGLEVPDDWIDAAGGAFVAELWAEALARDEIVLDRRGTERLVAVTTTRRLGAEVPLPGGVRVRRGRDGWTVGRVGGTGCARAAVEPTPAAAAPLVPPRLAWGEFCFQYGTEVTDAWTAALPSDRPLAVRAWRPGDRISGAWGTRRVVRFFQEQGIPVALRRAWPVIAIGDEIVWVPGIARDDARVGDRGGRGDGWRCERRDDR